MEARPVGYQRLGRRSFPALGHAPGIDRVHPSKTLVKYFTCAQNRHHSPSIEMSRFLQPGNTIHCNQPLRCLSGSLWKVQHPKPFFWKPSQSPIPAVATEGVANHREGTR